MLAREVSNSVDDGLWISHYIGTICRQLKLDYFCCVALPSDLQLQQLWFRSLDDSDVFDQQAKHALAITWFGGWSGPQSWEVADQLQDLLLLFTRDGAQRLPLEVGELRLELKHALRRVIPALLEGTGDQSIVG